jgi:simple sugar transport system ATP-binding protein
MMFGKQVKLAEREVACPGNPVIELRGVNIEDHRLRIQDANLCACAGEVIGLAGMEGSGQSTFLRSCAGLVRPVAGKTLVNGKDLTGKNFHTFMHHGVAYLPAARLEEGLIPGLSLVEHFVLAGEQRGLFVDRERAQSVTQEQIAQFNIRGVPGSTVESLSGGNQQRALLALMKTQLSLILMEHPTRGLDVESSIYIWSKLKERCRQGSAIVFISSDLEEILHYSDRILVFFAGKVSAPLDASQTTVDQLGQLIGGKGW